MIILADRHGPSHRSSCGGNAFDAMGQSEHEVAGRWMLATGLSALRALTTGQSRCRDIERLTVILLGPCRLRQVTAMRGTDFDPLLVVRPPSGMRLQYGSEDNRRQLRTEFFRYSRATTRIIRYRQRVADRPRKSMAILAH